MKNETFEKTTTRKPLEIIFATIIVIAVLLLPIIVTSINTRHMNQEETKKVASVTPMFSIFWKEFMAENYSYVELYLDNDDITEIWGYVRDTNLENTEITFYDAIRNGDVNAYINGNRTYTVNVENMTKMYVYKNDRIVKMVKVEK
ncbi:MAG: hypothetical protein HFJ35_04415 [Clostridia bacterium]|nr:hypothetical protein [Clostridia bacterium]